MPILRSTCWFALLLILAATPARQVEAASDFARTAAEVGAGDRVEEEDGGVGDDAIEATPVDGSTQLAVDLMGGLAPAVLGAFDGGADALAIPKSLCRPAPRVPTEMPPGAGRRQAWLGRFLF